MDIAYRASKLVVLTCAMSASLAENRIVQALPPTSSHLLSLLKTVDNGTLITITAFIDAGNDVPLRRNASILPVFLVNSGFMAGVCYSCRNAT